MKSNLVFRSSDAALDYIERFFEKRPIKSGVSLFGVVRKIDSSGEPLTYLIEVCAKVGLLKKRNSRELVIGISHPELNYKIRVGDLVNWGCEKKVKKISTGFVLNKFVPELNPESGLFIEFQPDESEESKLSEKQFARAESMGITLWKRDLDLEYGNILKSSEILEDADNFYFHYKRDSGYQRTIAWDKQKKNWLLGYTREVLEGLNYTSNRVFEKKVFSGSTDNNGYTEKQMLKDFLQNSLSKDGIKSLAIESEAGNTIAFKLGSLDWNNALIGKDVNLRQNAVLKFANGTSKEVRCQIMFRDQFLVLIVMNHSPEELAQCSIKSLHGYYSQEE